MQECIKNVSIILIVIIILSNINEEQFSIEEIQNLIWFNQ